MSITIRPARAGLLSALLLASLTAAACGATGAPASGSPSAPVTDPSPSADPGPAIDTDTLLAAAADHDGRVVRVKGFFLAADGVAQLCSAVLESYPPQCGGGTVRLTGEVPADILAALDGTTEPDIAQATWGWVEVVGTFRAQGAAGAPTIELSAIQVVEA